MDAAAKRKEAQKITFYGAIIDGFVGVVKIILGLLYSSHALVVDGIHSFSDLFTDIFVILIARYSHDEPDEEHPYGHGRFETFGTVVLGSILIGVSGIIIYENVMKFFLVSNFVIPGWPTLIGAALSIGLKEWAYRFQVEVGKKIGSQMIVANAWHSRSDAISSLAVFIGLVFSMLGLAWLDIVMAIVVAVLIGKIGWDFLWSSVKELVDTSIAPEQMEKVQSIIMNIDGVRSMHNLRSRRVGDKAILDVNIEVAPRISVSEGHEISTYVSQELIKQMEDVIDVTVHTDVEDDRIEGEDFKVGIKKLLPLRSEVLNTIQDKLHLLINKDDILDVLIHYHGNYISLEVVVPVAKAQRYNKELLKELNEKCQDISWLKEIRLYLKVE